VGGFLARLIVTYAYIFFSKRSNGTRDPPSAHLECSPTKNAKNALFHGFGIMLMPDYYPRATARLVSCYALFK
jgi:hypothetical protein